jgi:hypothetical protein
MSASELKLAQLMASAQLSVPCLYKRLLVRKTQGQPNAACGASVPHCTVCASLYDVHHPALGERCASIVVRKLLTGAPGHAV